MRCHRVRGYHPPALAEDMRQRIFIPESILVGWEPVGDEWEAAACPIAHDGEVEFLQLRGEMVCGAGEVLHDGAVAVSAEPDELVVLADDVGGALGEVERKRCLLGAEVVDVEDEFFREVLG